jgi:exopolysaccharide biosynthesis polyprenyl glycosylphosphotransferase
VAGGLRLLIDAMASTDELTAPATSISELAPSIDAGIRRQRPAANRPLVDAVLIVLAFLVEAVAPPGRAHSVDLVWLVLFALCVLSFRYLPATSKRRLKIDALNELRDLVLATTLSAMIVLSIRVVATNDPSVALQTVRLWGLTTGFLIIGSVVLGQAEMRARWRGESAQATLIVGAGQVGRLTARRLLEDPGIGLRPIGFLDGMPGETNGGGEHLPVLGGSGSLDDVINEHRVQHVIFTFSSDPHQVLLGMMKRCHELGVSISVVPRLFEKMTTKIGIDHVGGLPLISIPPFDPAGWQFRFKYLSDRVLAAMLLVIASPVLIVSAVLVRLSLGSPILYRQRRVGLDGQRFEILKFRSMKEADDEGLPRLLPGTAPGGVEGADRRTRIGKIMRRTSLDELPQLVNVLRGEMALVGPRPERPEFAELFEREVYRYGERLRVKSGITGWAQVNGLRGQTSLEDRVEWDNYYIENWSLWLDLKILLLTLRAIIRFAAD